MASIASISYVCHMKSWDQQRKKYKELKPYYYHLSSDGWKDGLLFHTEAHFAFGMILIGLLSLRYHVVIYEFTLMPNHIHLLMKGSGEECLKAFDYFRKKLSSRLVQDGYPPLPEDYGFLLTPIDSEEQMRTNILYVARNPYEKNQVVAGGYPWGTAYLHFSSLASYVHGRKACQMNSRELMEWTGTRTPIPSAWEFHPQLGLLPACFVDCSMFQRLFSTPKLYETHLIKDYEAFVQLGKKLNETIHFTIEEVRDMVHQYIRDHYPGKQKESLTSDEKGHLCVTIFKTYNPEPALLANVLGLPEYLVHQFLYAKDYGRLRRQ